MILAANTAGQGLFASQWSMIAMMALLFGAMYFLMIRPQKKEQKRVAAMLAEMKIGDAIVTTSGFYGILIDVTDEDVIVEFGNNKNCRIPMRKGAIAEVESAEAASESTTSAPAKSDKK